MEILPPFRLRRPATVAEAVAARAEHEDARYVAGGTDLLANIRRGLQPASVLVDLSGVAELGRIERDESGLRLGAAATLAEVARDQGIARDFPALAEAARSVAGPTHREMGTVGGNLCLDTRCLFYNQSEWWRGSNDYCLKYEGEICHVVPTSKRCYAAYSGDLAPALLVLDAEVEIAGPKGARRMPLADLFRDDGMDHLTLGRDELLVAVRLPAARAGLPSAYVKLRIRRSIDFPLAGIAMSLALEDGRIHEIRAALTGTNSRPFLLSGTETLTGRDLDDDTIEAIGKLVQKQVSPVHTTTTRPQYRRRAIAAMSRRLVRRLAGSEPAA